MNENTTKTIVVVTYSYAVSHVFTNMNYSFIYYNSINPILDGVFLHPILDIPYSELGLIFQWQVKS